MKEEYLKLFKNFGLIEKIGRDISVYMSINNKEPDGIIINLFDFEVLKFEIECSIPESSRFDFTKNPLVTSMDYVFGIRIYKSNDIDIGVFKIF